MAISTKQSHYICAIIDAELKTAQLVQFDDDDRCTHLESILVQNRIREERVSFVL